MAPSSIPVIDMSPISGGNGAEKNAVRRLVAEAFENVGFMAIIGHGIPQQIIDEALSASRAFFDLPLEKKFSWQLREFYYVFFLLLI